MFSPTNFSNDVERQIVRLIIDFEIFSNIKTKRLLASYPFAEPASKDSIIIDLMDLLMDRGQRPLPYNVFRDFDIVLTTLGKKGHFRHQFEVFLIGLIFLSAIAENSGLTQLSSFSEFENIFQCWLLTATAHDFGYPLQLSNDIGKKLANLYGTMGISKLAEAYSGATEQYSFKDEIDLFTVGHNERHSGPSQRIDILKFLKESIQFTLQLTKEEAIQLVDLVSSNDNHGYVSALILCKNYIEYLLENCLWKKKGEEWREDVLRQAACAIALHSPPIGPHNWIRYIDFSKCPFGFLLFLIDNLQEWDRFTGYSDRWPNYRLTSFWLKNGYINFVYTLNHEDWHDARIEETKIYVQNQIKLIRQLRKPSPKLNIKLSLVYNTNDSRQIGKFIVKF